MSSGAWSDDDVRALVARSTASQGLPHHLEDAVTIAKVVTILDRPRPAAAATSEGENPSLSTGVTGVAGPCAETAARPGPAAPSTNHRPGIHGPGPAYRPNAVGQKAG